MSRALIFLAIGFVFLTLASWALVQLGWRWHTGQAGGSNGGPPPFVPPDAEFAAQSRRWPT